MLCLATGWYLWGFYLDDWFLDRYKYTGDIRGAVKDVARLRQFIGNGEWGPVQPVDVVQRRLAELWERTRPLLTPSLRSRFAASTFGQVEDGLGNWRTSDADAYRTPGAPSGSTRKGYAAAADLGTAALQTANACPLHGLITTRLHAPAVPYTGSSQAARSNTWPNIVLEVKGTNIVEVLVKATGPGPGR
jgi:hypothetical protein